jgi:hypothetical protein
MVGFDTRINRFASCILKLTRYPVHVGLYSWSSRSPLCNACGQGRRELELLHTPKPLLVGPPEHPTSPQSQPPLRRATCVWLLLPRRHLPPLSWCPASSAPRSLRGRPSCAPLASGRRRAPRANPTHALLAAVVR